MIEIREEKLRELLESRKKYIGGTDFPIDGLFADIAFLLSILVTDYKPVLSIPAKEVKLFFWLAFVVYTSILVVKSYSAIRDKYTIDNLIDDISNSSERPHRFSLIVIRNTFDERTNKYLLLYDARWKSYLFPYTKSGDDEAESRRRIKSFIQSHLGIPTTAISVTKAFTAEHDKKSVSDNVMKHYIHDFYDVDISKYVQLHPDSQLEKREFNIDGYRFRWYTAAEMNGSRKIMRCNKETVDDIIAHYGV